MTLAQQIAAAAAGQDTSTSGIRIASGESLKTKSASGNL